MNCISHSQYFVSCSRVIKLCVAVTCRPNTVLYSDQRVYKITLKALIQILNSIILNQLARPIFSGHVVHTRSDSIHCH
jgi:hypothetical protein